MAASPSSCLGSKKRTVSRSGISNDLNLEIAVYRNMSTRTVLSAIRRSGSQRINSPRRPTFPPQLMPALRTMQPPRPHGPRVRPSIHLPLIPHLRPLSPSQEIQLSDTDRTVVSAAAGEPEARPQEPAAEGEYADYAHRYGGVVEGLLGHGVDGW